LLTAVIAVYGGSGVVFALALGFGLLVLAISKLPVYERPRPRILLWILLAMTLVVGSALLFAGLAFLGVLANNVASDRGYSVLGTYVLVVLGGLGIILLSGSLVFLLATLVNSIVMFTPRSWKTAVMLAYRNMGRQRLRTTTTLTALFVGVFAIGLILILGQGIKDTINSTLSTLFTRNVFVIVPPTQRQNVAAQLPSLKGIDASKTLINPVVPQIYPLLVAGRDINTILKSLHPTDKINKGEILNSMSDLEGFDLKAGKNNIPTIILKGGRNLRTSDAGTNNVVLNSVLTHTPVSLHVGDTLVVQSVDGTVTRILKIVGFYDGEATQGNPNFASVLADAAVSEQLGGSQILEVFSLKIDPDQLPTFKHRINKAVPAAVILSVIDIDSLINQVLNNLIIMLTTVASLAMIAGLIIIANAVALAMLERRREIGIQNQ
jgi:predicted lysophospholipase L1 biosynthesis ABC-type transport system permease subunit